MGRKGAGHKAYLTKMRNLRARRGRKKGKGTVVGFYKDHGKTKPITKSEAELNRRKIVKNSKRFKSVNPERFTVWKQRFAKILKKMGFDIHREFDERALSVPVWYGGKEERLR